MLLRMTLPPWKEALAIEDTKGLGSAELAAARPKGSESSALIAR